METFFNFLTSAIDFLSIKKIDKDNYIDSLSKLRNTFILIFVGFIIYKVTHFFISINDWKCWIDSLITLSILVFIFLAIRKLSKVIFMETDREISEQIIRKIFFEKNIDVEKMIKGYMNHFENYAEFIESYRGIKPLAEIAGLNEIGKRAKSENGSHFNCIISNPLYITGDVNKVKGLLSYFLTFLGTTEKNTIKRIFTIKKLDNSDKVEDKGERKKSSLNLLKYMLVNNAVGVSTFLLIYDNGPDMDFVKSLDYVLVKSKDDNILYFSFETEKIKDSVIVSTDNFLIKTIEDDFKSRMQYLYTPSDKATIYDFSSKVKEILKELGITCQEYISTIKELCDQMGELVEGAKLLKNKQEIAQLKKILQSKRNLVKDKSKKGGK